MAKKKVYGLTSVLFGPIGSDGGMGTTLTEILGATAKGTASLIYTPPTFTDVEIEEEDDPYDQLIATPGKWELKLESYNVGAKSLSDTMGGTYTPGASGAPDTWEPDEVQIAKESSARVTTRGGSVIDIPRLKYYAAPTFNLTKGDLGRISLTGTPLKPSKAGVKALKFTDSN